MRVLFRAQLLCLSNGRAAAPVKVSEFFEWKRQSTRGKAFGDRVQIGAKRPKIVHV